MTGVEAGPWLDTLVAGAAEGDELAVKKLLAVVVPAIVPYCRTQLGTVNAADIVVQDSCRAIIETLPRYRLGDESFWSFVNNITANKVSEAQSSVIGMGADSVALSIDPPHHEPRTPGSLSIEQAELLMHVLDTLPSQQRDVLILRIPLRLSVEDTAKIVGASPTVVRLAQRQALNYLRRELRVRRPGRPGHPRTQAPDAVTWASRRCTRPRSSSCRGDGKPRALTSDPRLPPPTVGAEDDQG